MVEAESMPCMNEYSGLNAQTRSAGVLNASLRPSRGLQLHNADKCDSLVYL